MGPLEAGPAAAAERAEPVTDALSQHLQFLAPALDPRVLRRAAREFWNSCAGVGLLLMIFPVPVCCHVRRPSNIRIARRSFARVNILRPWKLCSTSFHQQRSQNEPDLLS